MKAIRVREFGGPEVLQLQEMPEPRPPQSGEVLIRVMAAGVNPYDTYMRSGTYGTGNPTLPYTPGSDAAGVIESVGPDVEWTAGQRIYTTGTITGAYAELTLCRSPQVHSLPAPLSYAHGSGVYVPYATAYRALFQLARAKPGETVLVHGASGGVGLAAVQFARSAGLKVIGSAGTDEALELIKREGAHHSVNHRSIDYREQIRDITNGSGVDVIIEMLANVNLGHDLQMVTHGGRVVVVGNRGNVEINPRDMMTREASVYGLSIWRVLEQAIAEIRAAVQAGLGNGILRPVIASELPLALAPEAHRRVMEPGARGKIVLIP
jgi:NADPH2:quinone reductase